MTGDRKSARRNQSEKRLESILRNLPQPAAPPGLEDALIAGAPAVRPVSQYRRGGRFGLDSALIGAVAAAAIAAAVVFHFPRGDARLPAGGSDVVNETVPQRVVPGATVANYRETRPCDVLPPLPQ